jgi:hypothetical protein
VEIDCLRSVTGAAFVPDGTANTALGKVKSDKRRKLRKHKVSEILISDNETGNFPRVLTSAFLADRRRESTSGYLSSPTQLQKIYIEGWYGKIIM